MGKPGTRRSRSSRSCVGRSGELVSPAKRRQATIGIRTIALAAEYGRNGDRRITVILRHEGFRINRERIERLWRWEGLKVLQRQPKRRAVVAQRQGVRTAPSGVP